MCVDITVVPGAANHAYAAPNSTRSGKNCGNVAKNDWPRARRAVATVYSLSPRAPRQRRQPGRAHTPELR